MERKLAQYRAQQRRREIFENFKARFLRMILPAPKEKDETQIHIPEQESSSETISSEEDEVEEDAARPPHKDWMDYITYFVYFLFWATLYAIAIELRFGAVFFMLSCLFGIYFNTRTQKRLKNEPSAYSVFNPNVESIDGTLKAEQFEREIGLRVH